MPFVQADLDNIRECIASGVLETRFADGRVTRYQDLAALMSAEQRIAAAVAGSSPAPVSRLRYPGYRNGC